MDDLNFSEALTEMKARKTVTRRAWNPDEFIYYVEGSRFVVNRKPLVWIHPEGTEVTYRPHIDLWSGGVASVWSASQADILSNDWYVVRDLIEEQAEKHRSGQNG